MRIIPVLRGAIDRGFNFLDSRRIRISEQRGQDLIEFAVVLPILLLVAFGVLDLGRLFHAGITITNAARVGTRIAAMRPDKAGCDPGSSCVSIFVIDATRDEAANNSIDLSTALIVTECVDVNSIDGCNYGDTFRVTITYDFQLLLDGVISLPNIVLIRSAEMLVQ